MTDDRVFVDVFRKNSAEVIRVQLQRFAGNENQYLDVRVFMNDEGGGGSDEVRFEGTPTKKGITLHVDLLDRLVLALSRVRDILEYGGE